MPVVNFGGGIGGSTATPLFAGLTPTYAGLYQVNVTIPANTPKGDVYVSLAFGSATSNSVLISIQ
jgi:uncharacterized protein (TIGR03437 family)